MSGSVSGVWSIDGGLGTRFRMFILDRMIEWRRFLGD